MAKLPEHELVERFIDNDVICLARFLSSSFDTQYEDDIFEVLENKKNGEPAMVKEDK